MELLERLARKDAGWWSHGSRREDARALAVVWAQRSGPPFGAVLPWPRDHGIGDLLMVLHTELVRAGVEWECAELGSVRALL